MDRVDEVRRTRIEGVTEDSPPTGRTVISRRAALGGAVGRGVGHAARTTGTGVGERERTADPRRAAERAVSARGRWPRPRSVQDRSERWFISTTKIYPVSGVKNHTDVLESCGDFYTQFEGNLCAYDLPGGAIAMRFTGREHRGRRRWVRWDIPARNLGTEDPGSDRPLSEIRGWSQHHGRRPASPCVR